MGLIDLKPFSEFNTLHDFSEKKKCKLCLCCVSAMHGGFFAIKNKPLHHFVLSPISPGKSNSFHTSDIEEDRDNVPKLTCSV